MTRTKYSEGRENMGLRTSCDIPRAQTGGDSGHGRASSPGQVNPIVIMMPQPQAPQPAVQQTTTNVIYVGNREGEGEGGRRGGQEPDTPCSPIPPSAPPPYFSDTNKY
jgi:hypothetical protein